MKTINPRHALVHALLLPLSAALVACGGGSTSSGDTAEVPELATEAALGQALFNDTSLSLNRTQACASCHAPGAAFTDPSINGGGDTRAVSIGDDGVSLGDRNTPTAMYAAFIPDFQYGSHSRFNSQQDDYEGYLGGQFWDGRAADLSAQAAGPFLNPVEMNMPDAAAVVARLRENSDYEEAFTYLYGDHIFDSVDETYTAMTDALAAFERTPAFAPFTSKYDRSLRGEYIYSPVSRAAAGKALFFSQQFTNCATCHQLRPNSHRQETFSNYEFHNIGIPENTAVRAANNSAEGFVDPGLAGIDAVASNDNLSTLEGQFRVPTLRNVGVTAPYMHNGVFRELETVVLF